MTMDFKAAVCRNRDFDVFPDTVNNDKIEPLRQFGTFDYYTGYVLNAMHCHYDITTAKSVLHYMDLYSYERF